MKIEKKGKYQGLQYMVVAQDAGHRCGYVGLPSGHPLFEVDYNVMYDSGKDIDCHGGLTFSSHFKDTEGVDDSLWWLGFDCAHFGDAKDPSIMSDRYKRLQEQYPDIFNEHDATIKTASYVESECQRMIDQIIDFED